MTTTDLALEAASYITASGSPAANNAVIASLTVSQKRRMMSDLTAVMQYIAKVAPRIYRKRDGAILPAPVTANVTVTEGSKEITTAYGFIEGATINIGGLLNEIRTEGGAPRLVNPYTGASGTQPAIFYGDSIPLGAEVAAVTGSVWPSAMAGVAYGAYSDGDFGRSRRTTNGLRPLNNREDAHAYGGRVGCPEAYWVDSAMTQDGSSTDLIVTGTLMPAATGTYSKVGTINALPAYLRQGSPPFILKSDGMAWSISDFEESALWIGPTDPSPIGSYISDFGATGTATVASVAGNASSSLRLRFYPLPDRAITMGYDVRLRAPKFTIDDIGTDNAPSTRSMVVPDDYHESIVRPLFLEQFASSPWFRVPREITDRIMVNAKAARMAIEEFRIQEARDGTLCAQ